MNCEVADMSKTVAVVDEWGNEYEATYPKRARGLVKRGRARFISDNCICLARPPLSNQSESEEHTMNDINSNALVNINQLLELLSNVQKDNLHILRAVEAISVMPSGEAGEACAPGDIAGEAKANSIAKIAIAHEESNQMLIRLYEKMYDDLRSSIAPAADNSIE